VKEMFTQQCRELEVDKLLLDATMMNRQVACTVHELNEQHMYGAVNSIICIHNTYTI
jgi:hypothetical protein